MLSDDKLLTKLKEKRKQYYSKKQRINLEYQAEKFKTSVRYAEMYLKYCFLLNSGAILAFPTFSQLVGISVSDHIFGFSLSITFFSLGLVSALISIIAAAEWFNKMTGVHHTQNEIYSLFIDRHIFYSNSPKILHDDHENALRRSNKYRSITILFGTLSSIFFITGNVISGIVLAELDLLILDVLVHA